MKVVILGLPQANQQELFSLLTGVTMDTIKERPMEAHLGICDVKDPRIAKLSEMYKPKKTTYTKIEYLLLPDFVLKGPAKELIFNQLKNADEICFVVREESAEADVSHFVSELILFDLMLVEKRLDSLNKDQRKKFLESREKETALMEICKKHLEAEKPLKTNEQLISSKDILSTYQFFTLKPIFIVVNVAEDKIKDTSISEKISSLVSYPCIQLSPGLEKEVSDLPESDRAEFMKELGIDEPAINKMTRIAYNELGLISFFTVGEDEVRAWPVKKDSPATKAGAVIHTDIEKGFIRAEMMDYNELLEYGSEAKLKELGKFHLKGKDYVVQDGDILSFRFNV